MHIKHRHYRIHPASYVGWANIACKAIVPTLLLRACLACSLGPIFRGSGSVGLSCHILDLDILTSLGYRYVVPVWFSFWLWLLLWSYSDPGAAVRFNYSQNQPVHADQIVDMSENNSGPTLVGSWSQRPLVLIHAS